MKLEGVKFDNAFDLNSLRLNYGVVFVLNNYECVLCSCRTVNELNAIRQMSLGLESILKVKVTQLK